jgi:hypothetical protein
MWQLWVFIAPGDFFRNYAWIPEGRFKLYLAKNVWKSWFPTWDMHDYGQDSSSFFISFEQGYKLDSSQISL